MFQQTSSHPGAPFLFISKILAWGVVDGVVSVCQLISLSRTPPVLDGLGGQRPFTVTSRHTMVSCI